MTGMDKGFFDQQLAIIRGAFPDLEQPLHPVELPRVDGQFSLHADAFWADITAQVEAGTYRLRSPAASTEGLCGPFRGKGGCLEPLANDGDEVWIDPTMQAQSGDLVMVEWDKNVLAKIFERGALKPGWSDMYGTEGAPTALKILTNCGPKYWLATNESIIKLEPNRVLGVVRRIERKGVALYAALALLAGCAPIVETHKQAQMCKRQPFAADSAECSLITPNAATEILFTSVASTTLAVIAGSLATVSVIAKPQAYMAVVTASADVWQATGGGAQVFLAELTGLGGTPGGTTSQAYAVSGSASPGARIAVVFTWAVPAATAMDFSLWYNSGTVGNFGRGANIDLRVEVVKK